MRSSSVVDKADASNVPTTTRKAPMKFCCVSSVLHPLAAMRIKNCTRTTRSGPLHGVNWQIVGFRIQFVNFISSMMQFLADAGRLLPPSATKRRFSSSLSPAPASPDDDRNSRDCCRWSFAVILILLQDDPRDDGGIITKPLTAVKAHRGGSRHLRSWWHVAHSGE
jgi:hypothetical protein